MYLGSPEEAKPIAKKVYELNPNDSKAQFLRKFLGFEFPKIYIQKNILIVI